MLLGMKPREEAEGRVDGEKDLYYPFRLVDSVGSESKFNVIGKR
jgi:hypothetical protein